MPRIEQFNNNCAMASTIQFALFAFFIVSLHYYTPTLASKKSYIVYLGAHSHGMNPTEYDAQSATLSHYDLVGSVLGSYEKAQESLQHSYNKYINGFAAKLTEDEVEMFKTSANVVTVIENGRLELHTTRSWEFLGLEQNGVTPSDSLWDISGYGDGIIIGNLDTGVWPESKSFHDEGFGPIPSKWKGVCMPGSDPAFKCNNKLIGARYFRQGSKNKSSLSPRDMEGHGSHTLSTAGGMFVKGVSVFGFGSGVAKGGSPKARVATYKICWPKTDPDEGGCMMADVLAAFEAAIGDGVDVLSLSIGGDSTDYKEDGIAIGSFHAVRHGIVVVSSAGNKGPDASTVSNIAPWIFTVGASTSDRTFSNRVFLGNSTLHFKGSNLGRHKLLPTGHFYPLIDAASAAASSSTDISSRYCEDDSLDPSKVKGKIVVCQSGEIDRLTMGQVVKEAGGVGMILLNDEAHADQVESEPHVLPVSHISYNDGLAVLDYINKTENPTAYITEAKTEFDSKHSRTMAFFSSRGPSSLYPHILKPDVTAPGVNVIAAFSGAVELPDFEGNTQIRSYNVLSGTSMACPHVSGIVGLLKSLHPDWSPAAIRSAVMTTATTFDNDNKPMLDLNEQQATPFGYGAGHINPNAAADPGLIYNLTESDYLDYLCSIDSYTEKDIKLFTLTPERCTNLSSILDFNYPSITVTNLTTSVILTRILTNVGEPGTYKVNVTAPSGVQINVFPSRLKFHRIGERRLFSVELKAVGNRPKQPQYVFGSLVWSDGTHNVRSPLVVERA